VAEIKAGATAGGGGATFTVCKLSFGQMRRFGRREPVGVFCDRKKSAVKLEIVNNFEVSKERIKKRGSWSF